METEYFKPPGTNVSRGSYRKYLKRLNLDPSNHIKGTRMKQQWTGKLVDHYKWWKAGKNPDNEPAIDWEHAGSDSANVRELREKLRGLKAEVKSQAENIRQLQKNCEI